MSTDSTHGMLASDVVLLRTPQRLSVDAKESLLRWFCASLVGTSLEGARVILLDGGADAQLLRVGTMR